jgi:hypothetical protein
VPYKPAKILKVNPKGVSNNDFVFILGYPGRTFRNQPAAFYNYHESYMLKYVSNLFDWQIAKMEDLGKNNKELEIKYAAKIKSLANVTKNYKGKLQGFKRVGLTAKKYAEEKEMQAFINAKPELQAKFGDVIPRINKLYENIINYAPRNLWYNYIYSVSPTLNFASALNIQTIEYNKLTTANERKAFVKENLPKLKQFYQRLYTNFDKVYEQEALVKMISDAQNFDEKNKIHAVSKLQQKYKTKEALQRYSNSVYAKTKISNGEWMKKKFEAGNDALYKLKDPLLELAALINEEALPLSEEDRKREGELVGLMARYADAKSEFKQKQFIPDANATLRFTYGYVRGYYPDDAVYHAPFTTLTGVMQKENGKEYQVLDEIKELYNNKDFAAFMHPQYNDLPVNFLYNLDTTGGNSGSPVMNENGELVGVNFDRAYTATINDYAWNEAYSRSIAVDIRYVLWVVKKVAKADYLLTEMNVTL